MSNAAISSPIRCGDRDYNAAHDLFWRWRMRPIEYFRPAVPPAGTENSTWRYHSSSRAFMDNPFDRKGWEVSVHARTSCDATDLALGRVFVDAAPRQA